MGLRVDFAQQITCIEPTNPPTSTQFSAHHTCNARGGWTLALSSLSASPPWRPNPRDSTRRRLQRLQRRDRSTLPSPSPPHRPRRRRLVLLHRRGTRNRGDWAAAPLFFSTAETGPHSIHRGGRTLEILPAVASTVSNAESDPPSTSASPTHWPSRCRLGLLHCRRSRNRPAFRHLHTRVSPQPPTPTFAYLHKLNRKSVSP
jgi:hypothetical protein